MIYFLLYKVQSFISGCYGSFLAYKKKFINTLDLVYKTLNTTAVLLPFNLQYLLVLGSCVGSSLVRTLGGGWNRREDNAAIMKGIHFKY